MERDLKRERLIAKSVGPLKMWQRPAERRQPPVRARETREWLRRAESELRELESGGDRLEEPQPGPEFGDEEGVDEWREVD